MVTKCLERFNNPTELGLYFDAKIPTTVSLTSIISCQFIDGCLPPTLTLNITVAPLAVVTFIDDVSPAISSHNSFTLWNTRLNFTLNAGSTLTYTLQENKARAATNQQEIIIAKELYFIMRGKNSHATATINCLGSGKTVYKFKTIQDHQEQNTTSTCTIKGAMTDAAKLTSNNLIRIHKNCANVSAQQLCKSLLLGQNARAIAIPQLEIETDNVHCRHDATISRINQEHLFYLQSRGMTQEQAQEAFVAGFLNI